MIPKVIHYCWFGGNELPESAIKCLNSWKKYCPGYEIKKWSEENFDVNCCGYVREAYNAKKWAFVSDYARFAILYKNGGIYFDTDVEIIKPIDDILEKGAFMGIEKMASSNEGTFYPYVNPGLGLAADPGHPLYKDILNFYHSKHFRNPDGSLDTTTVVVHVTNILKKYGLKNSCKTQKVADIYIYPVDYFCPIDIDTGEMNITNNTYTIHHFAASWFSPWQIYKKKLKLFIVYLFGKEFAFFIKKIFKI